MCSMETWPPETVRFLPGERAGLLCDWTDGRVVGRRLCSTRSVTIGPGEHLTGRGIYYYYFLLLFFILVDATFLARVAGTRITTVWKEGANDPSVDRIPPSQ